MSDFQRWRTNHPATRVTEPAEGASGRPQNRAQRGARFAGAISRDLAARRHNRRSRFALLALLITSTPAVSGAAAACEAALESGPRLSVARVIDGETLAVADGREVRLAGALAPRAGDVGAASGTWPSETQAIAALSELTLGKTVEIAFAGRRSDRYGRLIAQLFVDKDGRRLWVQAELIVRGLARAYGTAGNGHCAAALARFEAQPRLLGLGLWGEAAYRIRQAGASPSTDAPADYARATFQLIEGRLHNAREGREALMLYIGARRGADIAVRVPRALRAGILEPGARARSLVGRLVRVRGWIEGRGGPLVEIVHAGQLEQIDAPTAPH